jgi:hypothetical protein
MECGLSYLQFAQPLLKLYDSALAPLTAKTKKAPENQLGIQSQNFVT